MEKQVFEKVYASIVKEICYSYEQKNEGMPLFNSYLDGKIHALYYALNVVTNESMLKEEYDEVNSMW